MKFKGCELGHKKIFGPKVCKLEKEERLCWKESRSTQRGKDLQECYGFQGFYRSLECIFKEVLWKHGKSDWLCSFRINNKSRSSPSEEHLKTLRMFVLHSCEVRRYHTQMTYLEYTLNPSWKELLLIERSLMIEQAIYPLKTL